MAQNTPRVIACLSWYEERPTHLAGLITSLAAHRVADHLVAVDGAYWLYPRGAPRSRVEQHDMIVNVACAAGLSFTLHVPSERWLGNEVEKRNRIVQLAMLEAQPDDWVLRIDGDELVRSCPGDLRCRLAATSCNVATVRFEDEDGGCEIRALYRALPGLRVEGAHYRYVFYDEYAVQHDLSLESEPTDTSGLVLYHRRRSRDPERNAAARAYAERRQAHGIET